MLLSPPSSAGARRLSGSGGRSLNSWWQVNAALDAESLEEMLSSDAPEELCDPILMTLYVEPLVSPSGETYSKATVARFENGVDPATREKIEDTSKLPPNRAIARQVNAYIQKCLSAFAEEVSRITTAASAASRGGKDSGGEEMDSVIKTLTTILKVIKGRNDDASLNFKRVVLDLLSGSTKDFKETLKHKPMPLQRALDVALRASDAAAPSHHERPTGAFNYGDSGREVYCNTCWVTKHAVGRQATKPLHTLPQCPNCHAPCTGSVVEMGDASYHPGCVVCFFCCSSMATGSNGARGAADGGEGVGGGWRVDSGAPVCPTCYLKELVPLCARCCQPAEDAVSVGGAHFHHACLTCQVCAKDLALGGSNCRLKAGTPYCSNCYAQKYLDKCGDPLCAKPVDRGVSALSKSWHFDCFRCFDCHLALQGQSFRHHQERPYCEACYLQAFAPRCHACEKPCTETVSSSALPNKVWHPQCFVCKHCCKLLEGSFFNKDDELYCESCHELKFLPRCKACTQPIRGEVITGVGSKWHPKCFACAFCSQQIGTTSFHELPAKAPSTATAKGRQAVAAAAKAEESGAGAGRVPQLVCLRCYEAEFLPKCSKCGLTICDSTWSVYKDRHYHKGCS